MNFLKWEFWPWYIFYLPIFPYLIFQIIKNRSYSFFYNANPGMFRGGLIGERKSEILALVPVESVPTWILIDPKASTDEVLTLMNSKKMIFPLIGKPDVGERGTGVALLNDLNDLKSYHLVQLERYLLQSYCNLPVEAGIFYVRFPHSEKGKIISLCTKELLHVEGDGVQSIEGLLNLNPRAVKHVKRLKSSGNLSFNDVPSIGTKVLIEPIGNHCRGTTFLDSRIWITPALEEALDQICTRIEGFYYGRLDIKAPDESALKSGYGLQVLEVNGISSEPGHIYQPGYPLWQSWKDVLACWRWMVAIALENTGKNKISS